MRKITIFISEELIEEIIDHLEIDQRDVYVQSTEDVIDQLKESLKINHEHKSKSANQQYSK